MRTLTDRITRYLLGRLRRHAIHDAYERAAEAGLLESAFIDRTAENGRVWKLPAQMPLELTRDDDMDAKRIARMLRRSTLSVDSEKPVDRLVIADDDEPTQVRSMPKHRREREEQKRLAATMPAGSIGDDNERAGEGRAVERDRILRLLRMSASMPSPADVAVVLSVARAVGESVGSLEELLAWFRRLDPMIILAVPLDGFEDRFGKMLEDGRIIPRSIPQSDGFGHYALSGRFKAVPENSQYMITFGGLAIRKISDGTVRHSLAKSRARDDVPIVIADESRSELSGQVLSSADLILRLAHIDRALIAELLHVCCGIAPRAAFAAMSRAGLDPRGISLDGLILAVRPGRSADRIIDILKTLGKDGNAGDEDESIDRNDKSKNKKNNTKVGADSSKAAHRFELIQPTGQGGAVEGDTTTATQQFDLSIETLAGYGAAKDWALDLKADLPLWRDKHISWSDLSSRLLLSGPPGTGKTTFAKALCNTLGVPMLATSVAHWLEPGYLGDVLKLMSAAFQTAQAHAPAILFIDEFDNIGLRSGDSRNADYWNSVINRLLQLLDGAGKLDGIIVVAATNHPDMIDPALLRSGRLERHVVIPQPDTDALTGIIRHHLGADLQRVLASRGFSQSDPTRTHDSTFEDGRNGASAHSRSGAETNHNGGLA